MQNNFKTLALLVAILVTGCLNAQTVFEGTLQWHNTSHAAWKIEPQSMQNYVIAGNRFFSSPNKEVYISEFSEFADFNSWTRVHATDQNLVSFFWKSFCSSTYPEGYFIATSTTNNKAYTILTNATGHKMWDRVSDIPVGVSYGGACQATNGGFLACGGNNSGKLIVTRFDAYGVALWTKDYSPSGFGWCIKPANGGGYVVAGTNQVILIDVDGNLQWSRTINPGISPDGSAYSYSEFEEILPLPEGQGFVVTASTFSNSHSGIVATRMNWNGSTVWTKITDVVNTSLAGTPVCWVNNAVLANNNAKVIASWRRGPVSAGGGMFARTLNIADGTMGNITGLSNNTLVREAFATRAHGRLVIGGTAGNLARVYAYANTTILNDITTAQGPQQDETNIPVAPTVLGLQTNVYASHPVFEKGKPVFEDPRMTFATRTAYQDLSIAPNPSSGTVYIGGLLEAGASLRIFDLSGRLVAEQTIPDGAAYLQFDLQGRPKGLYTVQMIGAQYSVTRKFLIE